MPVGSMGTEPFSNLSCTNPTPGFRYLSSRRSGSNDVRLMVCSSISFTALKIFRGCKLMVKAATAGIERLAGNARPRGRGRPSSLLFDRLVAQRRAGAGMNDILVDDALFDIFDGGQFIHDVEQAGL